MSTTRSDRRFESERQRQQDYRLAFESEAGGRVLADLARCCHLDHTSHVRGDACETAFREGERAVVLRILALLRRSPDALDEPAQTA